MRRKPRWQRLLLLALFALGLALLGRLYFLGHSLPEQQAAKRWSSDGSRYTQISVFMGSSSAFSENEVNSFRVNLSKKLEEASLKTSSADARLWVDACSMEISGTASLEKKWEEVRITGVKGDFFLFHPLELVSGYYFQPEELMKDRVVMDEMLAWKLFGSSDVAGMDFELNGRRCIIAGVVKAPSGRAAEWAYGSQPRIYAPIELITADSMAQSSQEGLEEGAITCYELLLPNPVKGFGKKLVTDYLFGEVQAGEEELAEERQRFQDIEVVENTVRFSPRQLGQLIRDFGLRSMRENQLEYPYWENIARVQEAYGALYLVAMLAALLLPVLQLLQVLHKKWKNRKWRKELFLTWIEEKREAFWEKRRKIKNEAD